LAREVHQSVDLPDAVADAMLNDFHTLNRITIDQLLRAITSCRLRVAKVELEAGSAVLPEDLAHIPPLDLLVSGVKLIAVPV